eukprot:Pgem_evm1s7217
MRSNSFTKLKEETSVSGGIRLSPNKPNRSSFGFYTPKSLKLGGSDSPSQATQSTSAAQKMNFRRSMSSADNSGSNNSSNNSNNIPRNSSQNNLTDNRTSSIS